MKNYRFNLKLFITVIASVSIFLTGIFLVIVGRLQCKMLVDLFLNSSLVILPLTVLYFYFEKLGWRQSVWIWARQFLKFPPDLRGRWEGTLQRRTDSSSHGFVIEIEQTMTKLQVCTYSENNSVSESILDEIASDIQHETNFRLCYLWEGIASNLPGQSDDSGKFMGYTILRLKNTAKERQLDGEYFTNRKPHETQGKIQVKWVGYELKRDYK